MNNHPVYVERLTQLDELLKCNRHVDLLDETQILLTLDPNNATLLAYKLEALTGLNKQHDDLGFLRKYCWYNSLDGNGFFVLSEAYAKRGDIFNAIVAVVYAMSVDQRNATFSTTLDEYLAELGYREVRVSVLTTKSVGHLALEPDSWLREQALTTPRSDQLYLFLSDGQAANAFFYELLKRFINIVENDFWYRLFVSRPNLLSSRYYQPMPYDLRSFSRGRTLSQVSALYSNVEKIYRCQRSVISLSEEDLEKGWDLLRPYNITKESRIICIHLRDSAYLDKCHPERDFSYHDIRDSKVEAYEPAIEYLLSKGYKVVRIGKHTNQSAGIENSDYYDFCTSRHPKEGDFLEVFLLSVCQFFMGTSSGPVAIAAVFDTPTLAVNVAPFLAVLGRYSRKVPKYYLDDKGAYVPFSGLLSGSYSLTGETSGLVNVVDGKKLSELGIRFKDNTAGDILESVIEFEERVTSRMFDSTLTDLQKEYINSIPECYWFKKSSSLIPHSFLKRNYKSFFLQEEYFE
jgi:putative glycosyltransferase (TIGR04372 family)